MPTLDAFINRGVIEILRELCQPILWPLLWNSVAYRESGRRREVHGFIEPDPVNWRSTAFHPAPRAGVRRFGTF